VVEAPIIQAVSIDQAEDFLAVVAQLFGQVDFGGQVMQHQQGAIEFDGFDLCLREGSGQDGLAIGFLADIANKTLDDLVADAAILDLGQLDPAAPFELADEAHVVIIIHTTWKGASIIFQNQPQGKTPAKSGEIYLSYAWEQTVVSIF